MSNYCREGINPVRRTQRTTHSFGAPVYMLLGVLVPIDICCCYYLLTKKYMAELIY